MYYPAYNIKSAELEPPLNTAEWFRERIHYTEYKALYDEFVERSAPFAADPSRRTSDVWKAEWKQLEALITTLSKCLYVRANGNYITRRKGANDDLTSMMYERMLEDVMVYRK